MIEKQELVKLIDNVQKEILTSNNIIDRIQFPYYYNHSVIPSSLQNFKKKLEIIRYLAAEVVERQPDLRLPNAHHDMKNLSKGTFAHQLSVALVVSLFGIGDCGECSTKLGLSLIESGFGNLAFVAVDFLNAKEGMEKKHSFIVANLKSMPETSKPSLSVHDFFDLLPSQALIGDAFLGLAFSPRHIPDAFIRYIEAYGGKTDIIQCLHFYNVPSNSTVFGSYLKIAEKIATELRIEKTFLHQPFYSLNEKTRVENTTLISLLREKTGIPFFGAYDKDYKVDAIAEISTQEEEKTVKGLRRALKGHGEFFKMANGNIAFVLEGINVPVENPKLIQSIQNLK